MAAKPDLQQQQQHEEQDDQNHDDELLKMSETASAPALRPEPWLVYLDGKRNNKSLTFYSLSERRHHVKNIHEIRNHRIYSASHGWLVLYDSDDGDCLMLNPVTMEKIPLPNWPEPDLKLANCAVSSHPHDPSCVVVFTLDIGKKTLLYCKPGDEDWTRQVVSQCRTSPRSCLYFPGCATLNGKVYAWTLCCRSLLKFQFNRDTHGCQMSLLDLEVPTLGVDDSWSYAYYDKFLVQCSDSELLIVELYYGYKIRTIIDRHVKDIGCKKIELYKVNLQDQVCEKMETLPEDCAIFLSYPENGVFYKIPREDLDSGLVRGNTIYFTERNDKRLYAYCVKERSVSVSLPCPDKGVDYYDPQWIRLPINTWALADDPRPAEVKIDSKRIMLPSGSSSAGGGWNDVPTDLLCNIQSFLFGADRCYFRLACKTWQLSFSNSTYESDLQLGKVQRNHRFPILMHIGNNNETVNFVDPITNSTSTLPLPSLEGTEPVILCSKHGWLLISHGSRGDRLFFFNPFTNERIDLPNRVLHALDGITFSSPPTSSDCMVIGYSVSPEHVELYSTCRAKYGWTYSVAEKEGIQFKSSYSNPVFHQGLFYIMGMTGNLCIFDPEQRHELYTGKFTNLPRTPCKSVRRSHLLESKGKLLAVFTGHTGSFLRVSELKQTTMAWKELHHLEDMMLFLSSTSLLSAASSGVEISGLGNKVFLNRFTGKDDGVFYSLATRKFHTFWSGYNSDDWRDTKEYTNSAWIEPNFEKHTEKELRWV